MMKDGVKRLQSKDSDFTKGKMSEILKRMKDYTDEVDQRYPIREANLNPQSRNRRSKRGFEDKPNAFKNNYTPRFMANNDNSIDINQTMKIYRGFQNQKRGSFVGDRDSYVREKSISKARESYHKRMQRNKLSKLIRPYVKTPEPRRSGVDGFRQSIEMANRKYYELRNSRAKEGLGNKNSFSHIPSYRSRSSNVWRHTGLQGISKWLLEG